MIDFHTHTFNSDGELLISELARRSSVIGYEAVAVTDHCDFSNVEELISSTLKMKSYIKKYYGIILLAGIEITHVPPEAIADLTGAARSLGAEIVIVHGETIVEPVAKGTNRAAIEAGVDILAHPGLIGRREVMLAKERGVALEITSRRGHSLTNGHVAKLAAEYGARLVIDSDSHNVSDLLTLETAKKVLLGAALSEDQAEVVLNNSRELLREVIK
ncbi:MAG: histidinol phosphate phosphatase domain-containing protein [Epsilonproteobacteria bacterium]|nr:histidinol phosphate phosphatase domain-containing protein [Campylobacterota bacterium]